MKRRSPRMLLVLFLLVLVGVILGTRRAEPLQRLRLADGTALTLETTTYGTEHRFIPGNGFQQLAAHITPTAWHRALGVDVKTRRFDTPVTVLWFTGSGSMTDAAGTRIAFIDDHGCELDRTGDMTVHGRVLSLAMRNYPRRQPALTLRFFEGFGGVRRLGELKLPTPRQADPPRLPAEPLPQTVRTEDFACTLLRFVTAAEEGKPALDGDTRVSVKVSDRSDGGWEPVEFTARDGLGNESAKGHRAAEVLTGGAHDLRLWHNLCAVETWKVRVDLVRTRGFAADQIWELNDIPLPSTETRSMPAQMQPDGSLVGPLSSNHAPFSAEAARGGVWLEMEGIRWDPLDRYHMSVLAWSALRGWWLSPLDGTDERGRRVSVKPLSQPVRFASVGGSLEEKWARKLGRPVAPGDGLTTWSYRLKVPPGAKKLNLRFAVHPTRTVEFEARPSRPIDR